MYGGTYNDKTGRTSEAACDTCPLGHYSPNNSAGICTPCPVATYSSSTRESCLGYPAGRYNNKTGQGVCPVCKPGTYSTPESTQCTDCPSGQYNDLEEQSACRQCSKGTYSATTGQPECTKCPAGTFNSATGQTSASTCTSCNPGYHSEEGSERCLPCPANTYSNLTHCVPCGDGKYSLGAANYCRSCHPLCIKCHGDTENGCDACYENILNIDSLKGNTCECIADYFYHENMTTPNTFCQPCHKFCLLCKGKRDHCSSCIANVGITRKENKCLCNSPNYFAYFNEVINKLECITCYHLYNECTRPSDTQCTDCANIPNLVFVPPGTCECKQGYYYDESSETCEKCSTLCKNCLLIECRLYWWKFKRVH
eukprot:TRINITY_DN14031_c0_g3_i1.p1 TRINITY_DN14031_c0_g3~~TRINITY_DN14031_c0_g3_i1.p1  ORF type:complete len:369 (+),score=0.79 TRINITY_DN14031_c0_g3_i1:671-1777(+)